MSKFAQWVRSRSWIEALSLLVSVVSLPAAVLYLISPTDNTPGWALAAQIWLLAWLAILSFMVVSQARGSQERESAHGTALATVTAELGTANTSLAASVAEIERMSAAHARHGDLLEQFHNAFHDLRVVSHLLATSALERRFDDTAEERWARALSNSLGSLAEFFTSETGHQCHAVVKQLVPSHGEGTLGMGGATVLAIARSHPQSVPASYEKRVAVEQNSDFTDLLRKPTMRYFLCNDLDGLEGYENPTRGNPPRYNSTIVWPVRGPRPLLGASTADERSTTPLVVGFLGVDSSEPGIFEDPGHAWLGAALADSLFAVMSLRLTLRAQVASGSADG